MVDFSGGGEQPFPVKTPTLSHMLPCCNLLGAGCTLASTLLDNV